MFSRILTEKNVPVTMRDGVVLRADVYRPDTQEPVPVIIVRTPYNKNLLRYQPFFIDQVPGAKVALQHNLGFGGACVATMYRKD